jgi:hypothetical protein
MIGVTLRIKLASHLERRVTAPPAGTSVPSALSSSSSPDEDAGLASARFLAEEEAGVFLFLRLDDGVPLEGVRCQMKNQCKC